MMLVMLGPDGCGKSTVIAALMDALEQEFSEMRCYHLKLPLNPDCQPASMAPVADPHATKPYNWLLSVLKLFYLLGLYQIGWWRHRQAIRAKDRLIVLDRYYYDLLIDPRRFRYGGPLWLAECVGRLIPKPQWLVLLDAPAEVLQSRKQEVPPEETQRQCEEYRRLVSVLPFGAILDATRPVAEIADSIRTRLLTLREGASHA